jgi:RNA polymerase sigma factor (sigma-70 family)
MGDDAGARGEESGLKAFFLQERAMLLRLLVARLGNKEEAEDVLQDVWLRLETMTSPPIAQPGAYLFRIANNIAIDRRRASAFRARREGHWAESYGPDDGAAPSGEAAMLATERLREIDATIGALPERTAQIFRLCRYEHSPRKSVAERLGISVSAVEKHLQTAYRAIHRLAADDGAIDAGARREEYR